MSGTFCPSQDIEVVTEGDICRARLVTQASGCEKCHGREGFFVRDDDGYQVFSPCDLRLARQRVALFNAASIGRRYVNATFETYMPQNKAQREALQRAQDFGRFFRKPPKTGAASKRRDFRPAPAHGGLLFWGTVGTGKTHLALAIFRDLTLKRGIPCLFVDYGHLLMDLRRSFEARAGTTEAALMLPLVNAEVLIVDELGKGRNTDWELTVLDDLISRRYNANRVTLFTTNLSAEPASRAKGLNPSADRRAQDAIGKGPPTLEERLESRIYSRIREMCEVVHVPGSDFRQTGLTVSRTR